MIAGALDGASLATEIAFIPSAGVGVPAADISESAIPVSIADNPTLRLRVHNWP